jgi:tRNA(Ile2) C34 agmatinyltransferase TiaS
VSDLDAIDGDRCEWCGAPFESSRLNQRFCCPSCKKKAEHARAAQARRDARAGLRCPQCGGAVERKRATYCSVACQQEAVQDRNTGIILANLRCADCGTSIKANGRSRKAVRCKKCARARNLKRMYDSLRERLARRAASAKKAGASESSKGGRGKVSFLQTRRLKD